LFAAVCLLRSRPPAGAVLPAEQVSKRGWVTICIVCQT
jgi:hypothetical protein